MDNIETYTHNDPLGFHIQFHYDSPKEYHQISNLATMRLLQFLSDNNLLASPIKEINSDPYDHHFELENGSTFDLTHH